MSDVHYSLLNSTLPLLWTQSWVISTPKTLLTEPASTFMSLSDDEGFMLFGETRKRKVCHPI